MLISSSLNWLRLDDRLSIVSTTIILILVLLDIIQLVILLRQLSQQLIASTASPVERSHRTDFSHLTATGFLVVTNVGDLSSLTVLLSCSKVALAAPLRQTLLVQGHRMIHALTRNFIGANDVLIDGLDISWRGFGDVRFAMMN
jgi:hypothetical protein